MQWNLNLATHLLLDRRPDLDVGAIILEASSRMHAALAAVLNTEDVNICVSFDPLCEPKNVFIDEALRQRCESVEEGVMASIREAFDL